MASQRRAQALLLVMATGVVGPQWVTLTINLWPPHVFAATYLVQAAMAVLATFVLRGVRLPAPAAPGVGGAAHAAAGRPLMQIARQLRFVVAVTCGAVSYLLMNFLMTAAPLAMHWCGHSQAGSSLGLQWHVIAMYGQSFVTGSLVVRFGAARVASTGLLLTALSAVISLAGQQVMHWGATLMLLGLGWNLGFLGASAECHRPEEKTRVQSLNDFIIFGLMAVGPFSLDRLLSACGW